jgi:hypothetical protein
VCHTRVTGLVYELHIPWRQVTWKADFFLTVSTMLQYKLVRVLEYLQNERETPEGFGMK